MVTKLLSNMETYFFAPNHRIDKCVRESDHDYVIEMNADAAHNARSLPVTCRHLLR